jgi:hypothetical protein
VSGPFFISEAGQRRYDFTEVGTLLEFRSRSSSEANLVANLQNQWTTPQGFVMIYGRTDLKPFKKSSYYEFDCNWEDFAFLTYEA